MLFWGFLRRADDAYTGVEGKRIEKKPSDWLQIGRLAVRNAFRSFSRCKAVGEIRLRLELALLDMVVFPTCWERRIKTNVYESA
jgi:hypothetical protein